MGLSPHTRPGPHCAFEVHVSHVPSSLPLTGGAMWQLQSGQNELQEVTAGQSSVAPQDSKAAWSSLQKFMRVPLHEGLPLQGPVPPEPPAPPMAPVPPKPPVPPLPPAPPPPVPVPPLPPSTSRHPTKESRTQEGIPATGVQDQPSGAVAQSAHGRAQLHNPKAR